MVKDGQERRPAGILNALGEMVMLVSARVETRWLAAG
jgi:hypothetical protein